jgi:5-methylcytosine-specific restriction protein A
MRNVNIIVYRYLTDADFFNMYKPLGTEPRGGGQKYIDFRTTKIPLTLGRAFFSGAVGVRESLRAKGPSWAFPLKSIGVAASKAKQTLTVYQRRAASVCIAAQHIHTSGANRVAAWHPDNGFPRPAYPSNRHQLPRGLAVYLVRTYEGEIWAGWFRNNDSQSLPSSTTAAGKSLQSMFDTNHKAGDAGFLKFAQGDLLLDVEHPLAPFTAKTKGSVRVQRSEEKTVESLFDEDEEYANAGQKKIKEVTVKIRNRNTKAVKGLKELYRHQCQITATEFLFRKKDGTYYTEAHHLVPLGEGGGDDPRNIVIVSAHIHRMLHYADVSEVDFSQIRVRKNGMATLDIQIGGKHYVLTWHPKHAQAVLKYQREG